MLRETFCSYTYHPDQSCEAGELASVVLSTTSHDREKECHEDVDLGPKSGLFPQERELDVG